MLSRSPMRRKGWTKPKRKWPVLPETVPKLMAAMRSALADAPIASPKDEPLRSLAYRMYVASHPCFACCFSECQAAHSNSPKHGKGKGLKADDRFLFPLCVTKPMRVGCHDQHDLLIDMSLEERREREEQYVDRMWAISIAEGWDMETLRRIA